MQDREWGEKEMGLRTESRENSQLWGQRSRKRGSREEMEFPERWESGSPIFSLFPVLPLTSQEVCGGGGTAQPPECSQVKGSRASDWSVWVL